MAAARVLSIGQCGHDHALLATLLGRHYDVEIDRAATPSQALTAAIGGDYALVLVNRLLDQDQSSGHELIRALRAATATPVMLVSDHPEAQAAAVADGALPGFGKAALSESVTTERLAAVMPRRGGGERA